MCFLLYTSHYIQGRAFEWTYCSKSRFLTDFERISSNSPLTYFLSIEKYCFIYGFLENKFDLSYKCCAVKGSDYKYLFFKFYWFLRRPGHLGCAGSSAVQNLPTPDWDDFPEIIRGIHRVFFRSEATL